MTKPLPIANSRLARLGAVILMLAALLAYYSNVGDDYDVWWHLKYGEFFVRHLTWQPDHTLYSWTPADGGWCYVTWLGSSALYLVYQAAGFAGLNILQWLIFGATAGLYFLYLRGCATPVTVTHIAILFMAGAALNPVLAYIKPELFTLLFFTATVFLYFLTKTSGKPWVLLYPPLFLVWVNTHGGFLNGLVFISLTLALEAGAWAIGRPGLPAALIKQTAGAVILAYAATLINPCGIDYPRQLIETLTGGLNPFQAVSAYQKLWGYLFPKSFIFRLVNTAWIVLGLGLALLALFIYEGIKTRRWAWGLLTLNLVFFIFGFSMFRASIYFCVVGLFTWAYLTAGGRSGVNLRLAPPAGLLALILAGVIGYDMLMVNTYNSWFGSKLDQFVPKAEAEFTARHNLPGPLFNDYLIGGYLIWGLYPRYKVFIDPRYGPYEKTGVFRDYTALMRSKTQPELQRLAAKYPFNTAIIHAGNAIGLIDLFLGSPDWALVYFDKVAAVFVRKAAWRAERLADAEMQPAKFENVANPDILFRAFYLYCNYDAPSAQVIYRIYERNVSRWHQARPYHLERMRQILIQIKCPA